MSGQFTDPNPLAADLDGILESSAEAWSELRGARLFVTGGTGFVGTWLMEAFAWANRVLSLEASAVVLTRDPERFAANAPHLAAGPAISLLRGDVVDFNPPAGPFTHVVHAAAESSTQQNVTDPLRMVETIVQGTRNVLEAAGGWESNAVLLVSSGGVYGAQPGDMQRIDEEYLGGPDQLAPGSAYAEAKRLAELLCAAYAAQHGLPTKIARCFAFVGPYLPIDAHFAIGNFIRDGLAGGPIVVNGDGLPTRSYLYAADLASWLWTILVSGSVGRAYNVGSEHALTVADTARSVGAAFDPPAQVVIEGRPAKNVGGGGSRYVPATSRAREELGLRETVDLSDALHRTIEWHVGREKR